MTGRIATASIRLVMMLTMVLLMAFWAPAHVVVQAAHQFSDLGVGEETQRHALQLGKERHAQVVDHAFADRCIQPSLDDRDAAPEHRKQQERAARITSSLMSLEGRTWSIILRKMSGETRPIPVLKRIMTSMPVICHQYGRAYLRHAQQQFPGELGFLVTRTDIREPPTMEHGYSPNS